MAPAPVLTDLVQTVHDRAPSDDALARLSVASEVASEVANLADVLVGRFVEAARGAGCSWARIGEALGVSKQGAQQRFVGRSDTELPEPRILARFTGRARLSLQTAGEAATAMGHNYVGTEHLLVGVATDREALGTHVLERLGARGDELRRAIEERSGRPVSGAVRRDDVPLTLQARRSLEIAVGESHALGHGSVGTEHLVLGLVREDSGLGGRLLRERFAITRERVVAEVLEELSRRTRRD